MKRISIISAIIFAFFTLSSFQIISTQLKVTVLNNLGKPVEGARVRIFEKEEDYKKEQNYEQQLLTDDKGQCSFKKLKKMSYFINVVKDNMNNWGNAEKTDVLEESTFNKITIVIQD